MKKRWISYGLGVMLLCCSFARADLFVLPPPEETLPSPPEKVYGSYEHPLLPEHKHRQHLPDPINTAQIPSKLSLNDAILLSLRYNPNVTSSELQRVIDKYNLVVARNQFEPQYQLGATGTIQQGQRPTGAITAQTSVFTPIGTTYTLAYNNSLTGTAGGANLTITQPLLRGFGFVNLIPLLNAYDNEVVAQMTFKNNVITNVVNVITNYLNLVQAYQSLEIEKQNLQQTLLTLKQNQLQVKAGQMSLSDLRQQQANSAQAQLNLISQQNSLQTQYQNFLQALGLVPSAQLKIDTNIPAASSYKIPDRELSIQIALAHNIPYQQALILMRSTKRFIQQAKENRKIRLDMTLTKNVPDLMNWHGFTNNAAAMLTLDVPIDDVQAKAELASTEVQYEQAKLQLEQTKEDLIRNVMNQWLSLQNLKSQIKVGEIAAKLQRQNWLDAKLKFKYGRSTMFEVISQQNQLVQAEQNLLGTKIQFQTSLTQFYQTLALTLDRWDIQLRY